VMASAAGPSARSIAQVAFCACAKTVSITASVPVHR
jgi:hypothetical protein